jgi:hypothetical protein
MSASTTQLDARTVVTPDAFDVSPELLGLPLAKPRKRLIALLIDIIVIGLITAVTGSVPLILGVVAAIFFMRAGFKRIKVRRNVFGRAMRMSVGCLGLLIGLFTAAAWRIFGPSFGTSSADLEDLEDFATITGLEDVGRMIDRAIAEQNALEPEPAAEDPLVAAAAALTLEEALDEYATLNTSDDDESLDRLTALRNRLGLEMAANSFGELEDRIEDLEEDKRDQEVALTAVQAQLTEAREAGVFNWLRNLVPDLSFGIGWASMYMTILLSAWNGRTVGKRMMGIRVMRLDGEPITWWVAFERYGGYAAGFATGLLGFAQVYWDANRQGIHDRIVGTVVVIDGGEKVADWESAL